MELHSLAAVAALVVAPSAAAAEPLSLVCHGKATRTESTTTFASVQGDANLSGESSTFWKARSEEMVRVRIAEDGTGMIKPPQYLRPKISVGRDGWWDLKPVEITDDQIKGAFSFNVLNHPSVVIDRHTGDIDIRGLGMTFSGSCEKAAEAPENRKF